MGLSVASLVERRALAGARDGRLLFAQVHEDPRLEIEVLAPAFGGALVVVGSGGCTALSLLAAGAEQVASVDLNPTQNHVVELKAAACRALGPEARTAFLGGWPCAPASRLAAWNEIREDLGERARVYWDAHRSDIAAGILGRGVAERFIALVTRVMRLLVHPRSRVERMLGSRSLEAQRAMYQREWDSRRWRLMFRFLLGRGALTQVYDEAMFANVENRRFSEHFLARVKHTMTALPVDDNYFLHYAMTGRYPATTDALPPYLAAPALPGQLALIDGPLTQYLETQPDNSVAGFSLSNICEWLDPAAVDAMFAEIVRTAAPGAVLCFRNFVGWTEVPVRWRGRVREDRARGESLFAGDRSLVNRRFAVCRIEGA